MLGTSLSAVAAFAALTLYLIAGDEIKANRNKAANNSKPQNTPIEPTLNKPAMARNNEQVTRTKSPQRRTRGTKTEASHDPIAIATRIILAHIKAKGPMTINKLSQELKMPKDTVVFAAEKLVAENSCVAVKRGGYPGLAPA